MLICPRRKNTEKWNAVTSEERDTYLAVNKNAGNKRFVMFSRSLILIDTLTLLPTDLISDSPARS